MSETEQPTVETKPHAQSAVSPESVETPAQNATPSQPAEPGAVTTSQPKQTDKIAHVNEQLVADKNLTLLAQLCAPGYDTPFFGCLEDPVGCALSCCCPIVVAATVKADIDGRACTIWDCCCAPLPFQTRQQFRAKHGYEPAGINDCVASLCCLCCMVNQEVREFAKKNGSAPRYYTTPTA